MNLIFYFNSIFALSAILLGFLVYSQKRNIISATFFSVTFFMAIWATGILFYAMPVFLPGLLALRIAFFGASFLVIAISVFIQIFPDKRFLPPIVNILFFSSLAIVGILAVVSDFIVKDVVYSGATMLKKEYGVLYPFFSFLILSSLILNVVYSIYRYKKLFGIKKNQFGFFLVGFFITFISATITNLLFPFFRIGSPEVSKYGPITMIFFLFFTAIAITKLYLFDVKVILSEFLLGLLSLILLSESLMVPDFEFKVLNSIIFIAFCCFSYYLIYSMRTENKRREVAEFVATRERVLRKNAEELADDLKHLDNAKTQFLLSTQHHLRSPLSIIQGYLSMINEGNYGRIPVKVREKITASFDATQKLIQLVNDLLDVAHFQMNKSEVAKESSDVVKLVADTVVDLKKNAADKNIYLNFNAPIVPIVPININAHGIREAIYNIIDNAIKYTQEGGVTVSVAMEGGKLRISVSDTGIGMNQKDLQGIFNRTFERGEKAKSVNVNGRGIGLYLAAQMVMSNGGAIRAKSEGWGKGTTFIIDLPMVEAQKSAKVILPPVPLREKSENSQI